MQTDFRAQYPETQFEVVHVDVEGLNASGLNTHWDVHNPEFPVLQGCSSIFGAWGSGYIPHTTILDPQGIVRGNWAGWSSSAGNAMHGEIAEWLPVNPPAINLTEFLITQDTNNDLRPDPGETVTVQIRVENALRSSMVRNLQFTLNTPDPWISVVQGNSTLLQLVAGENADCNGLLEFNVLPGAPVHSATMLLNWTAQDSAEQPVSGTLQVNLPISRNPLLVVDSDGLAEDNESFMESTLQALNLDFDLWSGGCSAQQHDSLKYYERIIWLGGNNTDDLDQQDRQQLAAFVTTGKKLLLSTQYLPNDPLFLDSVLASLRGSWAQSQVILGEPSGAFANQIYLCNGPNGAGNNLYPTQMQALAAGEELFSWSGQSTASVVGQRLNGSKTVTASFPIEAISGIEDSEIFGQRQDFIQEMLAWLDGPLDPVTDLGIQHMTDGQLRLTWSPVPDAMAYNIYAKSTDPDLNQLIMTAAAPPALLASPPLGMTHYVIRVEYGTNTVLD